VTNFPRNISHERMRAPRTMSDAFGPYAKLHVPSPRRRLAGAFWMLVYGAAIGAVWYVALVIGVSR